MPFEAHPELVTPPDDQRLWRYMDFTKFVDLLETGGLYFAALDEMEDKFEGFLTRPTIRLFSTVPADLTPEERRVQLQNGRHNLGMIKWARNQCIISCWHENEHESAAMWRLYLKSDEGIAVRTSVGRFKDAVRSAPHDVNLGRVNYVDYETDEVPWSNVAQLAFNKRRSFEYEREVRAMVMFPDKYPSPLVPVDLNVLIDCVFVAPATPPWIQSLVERTLQRHSVAADVKRSSLDDGPLY